MHRHEMVGYLHAQVYSHGYKYLSASSRSKPAVTHWMVQNMDVRFVLDYCLRDLWKY
jgi:hypothetical protein